MEETSEELPNFCIGIDFSVPDPRTLKLICWQRQIFDGVAVVCDTGGVPSLGGSGGMLPKEIFKNGSR